MLFKVIVPKLKVWSKIPPELTDESNVVDSVHHGFSFEGSKVPAAQIQNPENGEWIKDLNGRFYRAGGVKVEDIIAQSPLEAFVPTEVLEAQLSFSWFTDLGIKQIWSQFQEEGDHATIAVLDTGYDIKNPDVKNAVHGEKVFVTGTSKGIIDINGHGTFCASILAGRNQNLLTGIAPKAKLLVGKISKSGGLPPKGLETMLEGIKWAIDSGADIISISFGKLADELPPDIPDYLSNIKIQFIKAIQDKQVLIFASSGDTEPGHPVIGDRLPASFPGYISVGATNKKQLSPITLLSDTTILHAQGENVEAYGLNNAMVTLSGTSMSTPMVAAIAALAVSRIKKNNQGHWDPAVLLAKMNDTGDFIQVGQKKCINPQALFQNL